MSPTGSNGSFFESAAHTINERAQELQQYASEVSDRISDKVDELKSRFKRRIRVNADAYVGDIEEAEEHNRDNDYILRGYRINHTRCKDLCKSLFTCHNEFVNVWSHILGVVVFMTLLTFVYVDVLPS